MKIKKLISVFCALIMLVTYVQIPAFAATYTAIDLSENKTRFTETDEGYDVEEGTLIIFTVDSEGVRAEALDNSIFTFESSDEEVVTLDADGNYEIVGDGASIITVSLIEDPSVKRSMIFYCGGTNSDYLSAENYEAYVGKSGFVNTYTETGGKGTQTLYSLKKDPWRSVEGEEDRMVVASGPFNSKNVTIQAGTGLTSYVLSMWQYDHYLPYADRVKRNVPRFGVTNGNDANYIYYGLTPVGNGNTKDEFTTYSAGYTFKYLKKVNKQREQGWHHFMMVTTRDAERSEVLSTGADPTTGITEIKIYYDGELVVHALTGSLVKPTRIVQSPAWVLSSNAYKTLTGSGLFQERYVAAISGSSEAFEIEEISVSNSVPVSTDEVIELSFNKKLDAENTSLSAVITETATGEIIEADAEIDGKIFRITPVYPLMNGREYELTIVGSAVNIANPLETVKEISLNETATFTVENADKYAENLVMTEDDEENTVSVDAEYNGTGTGYLVLAQYDQDGKMTDVDTKEITSSMTADERILEIEKEDSAVSYEGYVWSGLNALNIKPLADVVSTGTEYARNYADTVISSEETSFDTAYDVESESIVVKLTSKTQRKGLPVIIRVVYPGKNIEDANESNFGEIYARAEQTVTTEGGVLEYSFKIDDMASGEYTVIANIPFEEEAYTDSFKYVSVEEMQAAIALIQGSTSENAEANFEAARNVLDIDYTKYDATENKMTVLALLAEAEDCQTLSDFVSLFNASVDAVSILENYDFEKIVENKDNWGFDTAGDNSFYEKFVGLESASEKEAIIDDIFERGFNSIDPALTDEKNTLNEVFFDVLTVRFIGKMMNYSELFPFIQSINDVLELDLPSSEPSDAMEYLSEKLGEINGVDSLKAKYEEAITEKGDGTEGDSGDGEIGEGTEGDSGGNSGDGNGGGSLSGGSGGGLTTEVDGDYIVKPEEVAGAENPEWVEIEKELKTRKVFNDIESVPWAEDSIRELYNLGIISGKGEGVFAPNDYITREEAAKILILMAGIDVSAVNQENPFGDVNSSAWYAPYVAAAFANNIVNGTSQTTFGTGAYITREELCTLADRAATASDIFLDDEFTIFPFEDEAQISPWALNSVLKMRESFIVTGMGGNVFNPKAPVTRAQAAKIIYGVIAYAAQ